MVYNLSYMKTLDCAICGKKAKIEDLYDENLNKKIDKKIFSARRIPDRIHYKLVKCLRCGLIFSREILPIEKIVNLYNQSEFHYQKQSEYLGRTYFEYLSNYVDSLGDKKILDIGAGNGFFLKVLLEHGVKDVWGVEPGKSMVDHAPKSLRARIIPSILKNGLFRNNTFDVICCFHTLDHIVDPNSFLKIVNSLLKPGGKIFFVVHNTEGLSVKFFGEKSPIFDIEHIYLFNKTTLAKIFRKSGFRGINVFSHYNTYPLSYWIHLVPFPLSLKKSFLAFLKKSEIGNLPIKINPGNIGIVAQKN